MKKKQQEAKAHQGEGIVLEPVFIRLAGGRGGFVSSKAFRGLETVSLGS